MGDWEYLSSQPNAAFVVFTFFQADSNVTNARFNQELFNLGEELTRAQHSRVQDDEGLETDGHLPNSWKISLDGIEPSLDLHRNFEEAAALQRVAEELRIIAAQLEYNVVAQATQNLQRNISTTRFYELSHHINIEVENVMRAMQGVVDLEALPQERVVLALTLTLVKGVCQQAPQLLRTLFNTVLQYITVSLRPR